MRSRGTYFARLAGEAPGIAVLRPARAVAWHAHHSPARDTALARAPRAALPPPAAQAHPGAVARDAAAALDAVAPSTAGAPRGRVLRARRTNAAPLDAGGAPNAGAPRGEPVAPAQPAPFASERAQPHDVTSPREAFASDSPARSTRAGRTLRANAPAGETFAPGGLHDDAIAAAAPNALAPDVFASDAFASNELAPNAPRAPRPRAARVQFTRTAPLTAVRDADGELYGNDVRTGDGAPPQPPVVNIGTIDVRITQAAPAAPQPAVARAPARAAAATGTLARGYGSAFGLRQQ